MIERYKKIPNSIKSSFWIMFCSILQKGISFFTIPIFTRLLSTDEYGLYSLFLSWENVIIIFSSLNLSYQVFNNGMIKFKDDKDGYTTSMVGLTFFSWIISFTIMLFCNKLFYKYSGLNIYYLLLMFIDILGMSIVALWIIRKKFEFDYKPLTKLTIIFTLLNPLLGIIFVKYANDKLLFRIISIVITSVIYGMVAFILIKRKSNCFFNKNYWTYALKLDLPLIPHYLSMVILNSSDRIMIGYMVGKSATAFYSISYNISMIMTIVINAINSSLTPWIYRQMQSNNYLRIKKITIIIIILVGSMSILPMFFGPEVVYILGGQEYMVSSKLIPIISSSIFFIYLYSLFISIEMYFEKNIYITIGTISASIINILTNYIFILKFGYESAAYTTLFSYCFLSVFHYIMMKKACEENNLKNCIFDIKVIIIFSLVILIISFFISLIYDNFIARYIILFIILLIIFILRKKILGLFKMIKDN